MKKEKKRMTNEFAIIILNSLKQYYNDKNEDSYVGFDDEDNETIDTAIKALEQEQYYKDLANSYEKTINKLTKAISEQQPCEDCISREEAKKLIQGKIDDIPKNKDGTYDSMFGQYVNGLYCAKTAISYMSSVTPQPKLGEWIVTGYDYKCNNCEADINGEINYMSKSKIKYCPYCGAKMESEED